MYASECNDIVDSKDLTYGKEEALPLNARWSTCAGTCKTFNYCSAPNASCNATLGSRISKTPLSLKSFQQESKITLATQPL